MSPRHSKPRSSATTPRDINVTLIRDGERKGKKSPVTPSATSSRLSSVPTLPDVHNNKTTSGGGPQGAFLHSLLAEEHLMEEEEEEAREGQRKDRDSWANRESSGSSGSRSGVSKSKKGKVVLEEYGNRLGAVEDRSSKLLDRETLTARSDKILTASWAGSAETPEQTLRGQRRRHSRDSGNSTRRLSSQTVPSKKKFKTRIRSNDLKPQEGSQRRYSSPTASLQDGSTKVLDSDQQDGEGSSVDPREEETLAHPANPVFDAAHVLTDVEKSASESAHNPEKIEDETTNLSSDSTKPSDSGKVVSDLGKKSESMTILQDSNTEETNKQYHSIETMKKMENQTTPFTSQYEPLESNKHVKNAALNQASMLTTSTQRTTPSTKVKENTNATNPEPFNQWTTCRALEDSDDENIVDDNDNDADIESLANSEVDGPHHAVDPDGSTVEQFSRATSSHHLRRKRPLLLPPIMLPPIYTVKPTPLKLRDDMYFMGAGSRARRPISDEEWDKLRDCRYLRIRTMRRSLKV